MALGGDQELIAALRTPSGQVWGALGLYRESVWWRPPWTRGRGGR